MGAKKPIDIIKQNEIINKLEKIIIPDPENKTITLLELDNNLELQQKILNLIPEIREAFIIHNTPSLIHADQMKRPYLSIMRHYLSIKYKIIIKNSYIKNSPYTKKYTFLEK
jgi:hypothetical protein